MARAAILCVPFLVWLSAAADAATLTQNAAGGATLYAAVSIVADNSIKTQAGQDGAPPVLADTPLQDKAAVAEATVAQDIVVPVKPAADDKVAPAKVAIGDKAAAAKEPAAKRDAPPTANREAAEEVPQPKVMRADAKEAPLGNTAATLQDVIQQATGDLNAALFSTPAPAPQTAVVARDLRPAPRSSEPRKPDEQSAPQTLAAAQAAAAPLPPPYPAPTVAQFYQPIVQSGQVVVDAHPLRGDDAAPGEEEKLGEVKAPDDTSILSTFGLPFVICVLVSFVIASLRQKGEKKSAGGIEYNY